MSVELDSDAFLAASRKFDNCSSSSSDDEASSDDDVVVDDGCDAIFLGTMFLLLLMPKPKKPKPKKPKTKKPKPKHPSILLPSSLVLLLWKKKHKNNAQTHKS